MTLEPIDNADLSNVTGGAGSPAKALETLAKAAKALKTRKIGNVKLIGNQSLDDIYWESKPF